MMWTVVLLAAAALTAESYSLKDHERLSHGRQLKIYLSKNSDSLEFIPAYDPQQVFLYWEKGRSSVSKGRLTGTGSDRRWYIDEVTYNDQGTYIQRDFWRNIITTFKVAVTPRHVFMKCVAGESLYISLQGLELSEAELIFSAEHENITLVHDGAAVSQDIPSYYDRVQTHYRNIEIRSVNLTDEGHYTLKNRKNQVVSVTRMDIVDHHENTGNPLMALLLLLGIPAGICCCCRKKIFKKKSTTAATLQMTPDAVHPPPGPAGPCPPYANPGQPGMVLYPDPNPNMNPTVHPPPAGPPAWNGPPPSPSFNPAYPPANPGYPQPNPGYPQPNPGYAQPNPGYPQPNPGYPMGVPAQPPQWNGPPPGQYPPAPGAPMGYAPAPVMYSAPQPDASSPAEPLLSAAAPAPEPASSPEAPVPPAANNTSSATNPAHTFQIDGTNSSTNFL